MSENLLITGVSSGIGHALARHYLELGHSVYGISRRTPRDLIENEAMHFQAADLESLDDINATLKEILDGVEKLDWVILNAGVLGTVSDIQESPMYELKQTMDINLWSNKILLDTLLELPIQFPQVVAISSGAAVNAHRGWGGYSLSKAGLNVLMKLYSEEVPDTHFVAMAPGLVDTRMQEYLCEEVDDPRFVSLERIRNARNTPDMPNPPELAPVLVQAFEEAKSIRSGDYVDVRDMDVYQAFRDTAIK
jgi:NAD(P)-dependent dehydrogenase (short-subunit alcohol dehydrogenase family)